MRESRRPHAASEQLQVLMSRFVLACVCGGGGGWGCWRQPGGIHHFLGTGSGASKYYCARIIGVARLPGSDGQCGPNNGPQCLECVAHQASLMSVSERVCRSMPVYHHHLSDAVRYSVAQCDASKRCEGRVVGTTIARCRGCHWAVWLCVLILSTHVVSCLWRCMLLALGSLQRVMHTMCADVVKGL